MPEAEELPLDRLVEEGDQVVEIAVRVEQSYRLVVETELRPGQHLEKFFQGPVPARQRGKGVGAAGHERLALVHVAGDDQLVQLPVGELLLLQGPGDHPDDASPGRQSGPCDDSHQPAASPAVHQPHPQTGDGAAHRLGLASVPLSEA